MHMTDMTGRGPALSAGLCLLLHLAVFWFRCLLCDELVLPLLAAATLNAALLPKPLCHTRAVGTYGQVTSLGCGALQAFRTPPRPLHNHVRGRMWCVYNAVCPRLRKLRKKTSA